MRAAVKEGIRGCFGVAKLIYLRGRNSRRDRVGTSGRGKELTCGGCVGVKFISKSTGRGGTTLVSCEHRPGAARMESIRCWASRDATFVRSTCMDLFIRLAGGGVGVKEARSVHARMGKLAGR
jgi:hypothetical protein